MIRNDFKDGNFPISRTNPVLCLSDQCNLFVAYDRYTLHQIFEIAPIIKCVGIWPGKKNTDIFKLNVATYKNIPVPPAEHKDIDSSPEIIVKLSKDENFIELSYTDPIKEVIVRSKDVNLYNYVKQTGMKQRTICQLPTTKVVTKD